MKNLFTLNQFSIYSVTQRLVYAGTILVYIGTILVVMMFMSTVASAQHSKHVSSFHGPTKTTMLKMNVSNAFRGEYTLGLEQKIGLKSSYYVNGGWLHKSQSDMNAAGLGITGGLRYYPKMRKRLRKGKNKSQFAAFSGNYWSVEGRYGLMRSLNNPESSAFDKTYSKLAVHYGIQRAWKHVFINAEFGPSWGNSDFTTNSNRGYFHDGLNIDGKITVGLAF